MTERKKGRPPRWGARKTHSIAFPMSLYDTLCDRAAASGMNLTEYVILGLADHEGVELPTKNRDQHELPISA